MALDSLERKAQSPAGAGAVAEPPGAERRRWELGAWPGGDAAGGAQGEGGRRRQIFRSKRWVGGRSRFLSLGFPEKPTTKGNFAGDFS